MKSLCSPASLRLDIVLEDTEDSGVILDEQVDYQERFSAAGRIPHNAQRRELGPSGTEIGRGQSVQCALEPLFAKGFAGRCQASAIYSILMSPNATCSLSPKQWLGASKNL